MKSVSFQFLRGFKFRDFFLSDCLLAKAREINPSCDINQRWEAWKINGFMSFPRAFVQDTCDRLARDLELVHQLVHVDNGIRDRRLSLIMCLLNWLSSENLTVFRHNSTGYFRVHSTIPKPDMRTKKQ